MNESQEDYLKLMFLLHRSTIALPIAIAGKRFKLHVRPHLISYRSFKDHPIEHWMVIARKGHVPMLINWQLKSKHMIKFRQ